MPAKKALAENVHPTALLDQQGVMIAANHAWEAALRDFLGKGAGVGVDYVDLCERQGGELAAVGLKLATGIRGVISGQVRTLEMSYAHPDTASAGSIVVRVARLHPNNPAPVVVTHRWLSSAPETAGALRRTGESATAESFENLRIRISSAVESLSGHLAGITQVLQRIRANAQVPAEQVEMLNDALRFSHQSLPLLKDIAEAIEHPEAFATSQAGETQAVEEEVNDFITRLQQHGAKFTRRRELRQTVALLVEATPLDDASRPTGKTFQAVTRDISTSGISLLHTQSVDAPYLSISLKDTENQRLDAVVEVLRCNPIGPLFDIGGRFVAKIHPPPQSKKRSRPKAQNEP
jgi:hypothetical protein